VTDEYPRAEVEEYLQRVENEEIAAAIVVLANYTLEPVEVKKVEAVFGEGVLPETTISLSKGYDNKLYVGLKVNEAANVLSLVKTYKLPKEVAEGASARETIEALKDFLDADGQDRLEKHAAAKAQAEALTDPDAKAKAIHEADTLGESEAAKKLKGLLTAILLVDLSIYIWTHHLKARWPKFLYFDEYYQLEGHVNIEKLKERQSGQNGKKLQDSDRPMLGLIDLARMNLDQLLNPQRTEELVAKLEGASNHLSRQILKYWSQNQHLQVKFDVRAARPADPDEMQNGTNLWGRVHDTVHHVSTLLGSRSKGFLWFFSFLAWFSQQRKNKEALILLLDEPGLFLHAKAQGDLLRYMEEQLVPHHQVIYTTHSPFMVDAQHFDRVRIVEDKSIDSKEPLPPEEAGTKVLRDILDAGEGSLFPLQGALGYDIAQTLFVGPNCLVVEGSSDLLYLQAMTALLEADGRRALDRRWTITPVGGSEKVPTFAALLGAQKGLTIATLIDLQKKDQQSIENLYKRKLLHKSHVLTFAEFTGTTEADIEDMFDVGFYLKLVNAEFARDLPKKLKESDVKRDQYPFVGASDEDKSELLKDILAFGNSWRRSTAFILVGVEEVKGGRGVVHGVSQHLADNDLQQFVNSKTNRIVSFSYAAFPFEGNQVGIITIPQQERPVFLNNKDFGKLKKQVVYLRHSTSTAEATPDEIARMGAVSAIDTWTQKELEQQRRDREEQRLLQIRLHGDVNRPNVLCDFPIIHTILYLRVKNYGTQPAKDIRISVTGEAKLPSVACLRSPISFMVPEDDLVYWLFGPQDFDKLPKKVTIKLTYCDLQSHPFEMEQPFDFAYFGEPGGGGRGVDISREENHPLVRELSRIADALTKGH
jgi:Putative DNA-binding domain/AAA ATPase domain